ncbi:junctional adhesion molecule A-like [Epinephelus lanceolatus]
MNLAAAASGFVVFLLSVQVIQGQDDWRVTYTSTEICAVKGSTVEIHCSYTYPSRINSRFTRLTKKMWFKEYEPVDLRTYPQYSGRVQYSFTEKDCTLRITDLRESDSAVYKFRFTTDQPGGTVTGSPGVTLSVTDLQVQVRRSFHSTWSELKCHNSCARLNHQYYVWYRNGQTIWEYTSSFTDILNPANTYYCALKGYENYPSPSVYAPKRPSVSVCPSAEIVEGSSVTLTCSSDANPAANYTWYKTKNQTLLSEEPQLVFSSIQSSDSGQYFCAAENELGKMMSDSNFVHVKCKSTRTMNIIRLTLVVVIATLLLLFCLCMRFRKKKTLNSTNEPNEPKETPESDSVYENVSDSAARREDAEVQEDLV